MAVSSASAWSWQGAGFRVIRLCLVLVRAGLGLPARGAELIQGPVSPFARVGWAMPLDLAALRGTQHPVPAPARAALPAPAEMTSQDP